MAIKAVSLIDLSGKSNVSEDSFVALKCFFDGGNQADPQYKTLTLCGVAGTAIQWKNFEKRWCEEVLKKHNAPFIHTTDMLTLNEPFLVANGWCSQKVDDALSDCVKVIEASRFSLRLTETNGSAAIFPTDGKVSAPGGKKICGNTSSALGKPTHAISQHSKLLM